MEKTNYYTKIGPLIKDLRKKSNMSRSQLADDICSVSYITRIENGERCPSSVILRQITNKLGITPEYLFRLIESSGSLQVNELLNQLFFNAERHDFKNIYRLITEKEKELDVKSIQDIQIIKLFKCFSMTMLNQNYQFGIGEIKNILNLTYTEGTVPNDIEFSLMFLYGFFLSLNNQKEEAYTHLINIKEYIKHIKFLHTYAIISRFYMHLICVCLDMSKLKESSEYLDYAIDYCKKNNTHTILPELYFLKSELCYRLKKETAFKSWYNQALRLHKLIKYSDDEHFNTFVQNRLNKLKTS
ncbi:helix-turn-helix domain-containing protein [Tepidibacter aestuarii]|uniref:helix-turn-helix domain-containing protein n=1 Tax=Tepidibacter aestuarii TaxID=2925782 RepID=UPI0020BDF6B8|nr:helix-turn-helix transcriptional regulator [Tepidibacter aestuarii]CAH2213394.1 HTH cro/C1-type domain-containing protein [Tepidibacter aestuarii]